MKLFSNFTRRTFALLPLSVILLFLPLAEDASACRIGERRSENMPAVSVTAPRRTPRWREFWGNGTYVAPAGWAITNFDYYISSKYRPNHFTWRWLGDGGNYASYEWIRSAYSHAIDAAARAGDRQLAANLRREGEYALEVANTVQSNRGAIEIRIMRRAAGIARGSRTATIQPTAELICIGTPAQIRERLNSRF
jgi:hypothetical protein